MRLGETAIIDLYDVWGDTDRVPHKVTHSGSCADVVRAVRSARQSVLVANWLVLEACPARARKCRRTRKDVRP